MSNLIQLNNVSVRFGDFIAVKNLSLEVQAGEVVGLLGSNGAGKSTTMKALAGIVQPFEGSMNVAGYNLTSKPHLIEKSKEVIGYCPDVGGLVLGATPREHIRLLLNMRKNAKSYELALKLLEKMGLNRFVDTPTSGFSHGMSRRLSVLLAALSSEKVLILDEPFDGVDPIGVDAINFVVNQAKEAGLGIVLSTHLQDRLTEASDRIVVMHKGTAIAADKAKKFSGRRGEKLYGRLIGSV